MAKNIKTRAEDYSQWYLDVIKAAQLADYSPVRGCMVIRPEGFAVWEAIQRDLDRRFKETGHVNAYFPLLIPMSFMTKEAQHVEGFAMECAVVTHHKLEQDGKGGLKAAGELEEPYIIRPTSETVIGHMYSQWIQSYRDLPVLINQWANVMRWEMRTRLFLRTSEFLWQEGHTAHETADEAEEETLRMLDVYADFAEEFLAVPVLKGPKTDSEKFPGAVTTYCIEALMQDGKALQAGTSHNLGQNFAKAFDIKFAGRDQKEQLAWTTSWGVSTRLIGALIMTHSDDEGLVLPPRVAPNLVAIIPIYKTPEEKSLVFDFVHKLGDRLCGRENYQAVLDRWAGAIYPYQYSDDHGPQGIRAEGDSRRFGSHEEAKEAKASARVGKELASGIVKAHLKASRSSRWQTEQKLVVDLRDLRPGDKQFYWEQRGVPFRIEVGPRDIQSGTVVLRSRLGRQREVVSQEKVRLDWLRRKGNVIQQQMLENAKANLLGNTRRAASYDEMKTTLKNKGGFVRCFFQPDAEAEKKIKEETKATVRCLPFDAQGKTGKCVFSGKDGAPEAIFAVAY